MNGLEGLASLLPLRCAFVLVLTRSRCAILQARHTQQRSPSIEPNHAATHWCNNTVSSHPKIARTATRRAFARTLRQTYWDNPASTLQSALRDVDSLPICSCSLVRRFRTPIIVQRILTSSEQRAISTARGYSLGPYHDPDSDIRYV